MKLFLSGGGSGEQSRLLDKNFIETVDQAKPVLYIPIAIDPSKHPYPECLEWLRNNFAFSGFNNFTMWTEEDLHQKSLQDFEQFSGIYVGGGNTFKLLKELREFGILEILESLAKKGTPIYGGSAGALIFAETIVTAAPYDSNENDLTDLKGINLARGHSIWVHYDDSMDSLIQQFLLKYNLQTVIAIPEDAGLLLTDTDIVVTGLSGISIFTADNNKTSVMPGQFI